MAQVRIGVIGAGWWAVRNHIPVLQSRPDVKITAVSRLGKKQLKQIQQEFNIEVGTEDYRELLGREDLDAVVVSSPHPFHFEHASAALQRGLHVLCEKPMVLRASRAHQLAELVQSRNLHFLIPYGWNYTELATEAHELLSNGKIGEIEHVHCHMASATRDLFSGEDFWYSKEDPFKPERKTWSDPVGGGGFAHGQLTHALALMYYLTGLENSEVFSFMTASKTGADLTDAISCRFRNGATGLIGGAGTTPRHSIYQVDIRLFGTEGMLLLDIERPRLELRRYDGRDVAIAVTHAPGHYACVEPLNTFVDLIQGKPVENRSSATLGTSVVEILAAAFRSSRERRVISTKDPD